MSEVEAKGGHLKKEAKGASQRRKSEGENWRHTPKVEVGNGSRRRKQTVQSNYGMKQMGANNTEIDTKKPKHREQIIPAMEC
jgi:hypothetical protein